MAVKIKTEQNGKRLLQFKGHFNVVEDALTAQEILKNGGEVVEYKTYKGDEFSIDFESRMYVSPERFDEIKASKTGGSVH